MLVVADRGAMHETSDRRCYAPYVTHLRRGHPRIRGRLMLDFRLTSPGNSTELGRALEMAVVSLKFCFRGCSSHLQLSSGCLWHQSVHEESFSSKRLLPSHHGTHGQKVLTTAELAHHPPGPSGFSAPKMYPCKGPVLQI